MRMLAYLPLTTVLVIAMALVAGLAAAYGRELQSGRNPTLRWFAARILLIPFLTIGTLALQDALMLSPVATAFTAAVLSLGGHDAVRMVEKHWRAHFVGLERSRHK